MNADHRRLVRRRRDAFQSAKIAAAWVIREDRMLLGIPSVRDGLIELAALAAIGAEVDLTPQDPDPENRIAIQCSLERAVSAARAAAASAPPTRPGAPRAAGAA